MDTSTLREVDKPKTCLACGKADKTIRRGLCVAHYQQFIDAYNRLAEDVRKAWEEELIRQGKVLPRQPGRRSLSGNFFAQSAAEFVASHQEQLALAELATGADTEHGSPQPLQPPLKPPVERSGPKKSVKR